MTRDVWVLFGTCSQGVDVLGVWCGEHPSQEELQEVILRLPMYVYGDLKVHLCGGQIPNQRARRAIRFK